MQTDDTKSAAAWPVGGTAYKPPPITPPTDSEVDACHRIATERRWRLAGAEYDIGVELGVIPPHADIATTVVAIYTAHLIAERGVS